MLINSDIADKLSELAGQADPNELARWVNKIEDLLASLNVNVNRKITTDSLFVEMAAA